MHNTKFWAPLIISAVLVTTLCLSPAISSLMNRVIIRSSGQISTDLPTITAASGYWQDIQVAVNWVVAAGGIGNVYIPEGTFNFVNVGESWHRVDIPAGVNIFGAPTERTSGLEYDGVGMNPNNQVVEWKTVLVMPYEIPDNNLNNRKWFFRFQGTGDPNKPSRISDIKFVGYHTHGSRHGGVEAYNIYDLRVDHCFFHNTAGCAVNIRSVANGVTRAVVDHCRLVNDYGYVEWWFEDCSVQYGIMMRAVETTRWEEDISKILGNYTEYTVFIEDNYFSRWRHCACANDGIHWVFRHNSIEKDSIVGSIDSHGTYDYVGTRAAEIYNNLIIDPILNKHPENYDTSIPANGQDGIVVNWRGGGGVFFNNYLRNYKYGVYMTDEGDVQKCYPHDIWIWNNTWVNVQHEVTTVYTGNYYITEDVDYFLRPPNQEQDGFEYTPYPYPHPLTIPQS